MTFAGVVNVCTAALVAAAGESGTAAVAALVLALVPASFAAYAA